MTSRRHTQRQLKALRGRASTVHDELGPSASDVYIQQCIEGYLATNVNTATSINDLEEGEKYYLKQKLSEVALSNVKDAISAPLSSLSPKMETLIDFVAIEKPKDLTGLIFVQTRAEAAVIAYILSTHHLTRKFSTATFVGSSTYTSQKRGLYELADPKSQHISLDNLRSGLTNLIVATDALEEGIDVVSCNVVICFDTPRNMRSFVQRRGRARHPTSRYVLLLPEHKDERKLTEWREMENIMSELFRDDTREVQPLDILDEPDDRRLRDVESGSVAAVIISP